MEGKGPRRWGEGEIAKPHSESKTELGPSARLRLRLPQLLELSPELAEFLPLVTKQEGQSFVCPTFVPPDNSPQVLPCPCQPAAREGAGRWAYPGPFWGKGKAGG